MTEAQWLTATDPKPMLTFLYGDVSDRRFRLFGCACCRRVWHIYDAAARAAVELAERYADGGATAAELRAGERSLHRSEWSGPRAVLNPRPFPAAWQGAYETAADVARQARGDADFLTVLRREAVAPIPIVRDVFGNPFRPVESNPAWLTSTVVQLARGVYGERAFDRLPVLADALQDAGCDNDDVLAHCRDPQQVHVRGCWVVDLVLGKS